MSGGPLSFARYITPEQAKEMGDSRSIEELRANATNDGTCEACGTMPVWRYGGCGMCFTCTTGEADASEDYELLLRRR